MIASISNEFIFIKTRKTASTSLEIVLSTWCNQQDICTPISPSDEITRASYGGKPQNFCRDSASETNFLRVIQGGNVCQIARAYQMLGSQLVFWNHMPAKSVRSLLPQFWNRSFKFCVERHPYEKAVSLAFYSGAEVQDAAGFSKRLQVTIEQGLYKNYDLYSVDRDLAVDQVVMYQDIVPFIEALARRLGRKSPKDFPRAKAEFRKDKRPAAEILSDAQKRVIQEICRQEFELFGFIP